MHNAASDTGDVVSRVRERADRLGESASHNARHTDCVLSFARDLAAVHGGNMVVLELAARLHDLGRADASKHGPESIGASCSLASAVLKDAGVEPAVTERVLAAIEDHDDSSRQPRSLEGCILRDADFLAGLGALGVLRSCLWAGESGEGFEGAVRRLSQGMRARAESLTFRESRRYADEQLPLVRFLLRELEASPSIQRCTYDGEYIVFEGISGAGKDTQMELLRRRLEALGRSVVLVAEPPAPYSALRSTWTSQVNRRDPSADEKVFLLLAARARLMKEDLLPALQGGAVVVSSRSYISTLVYQNGGALTREFVALCHTLMSPFDTLFLLDALPEEAHRRLVGRARRNHTDLSEYESLQFLQKHRTEYYAVCSDFALASRVVIVPPGSIRQTAKKVWASVAATLGQG